VQLQRRAREYRRRAPVGQPHAREHGKGRAHKRRQRRARGARRQVLRGRELEGGQLELACGR
jgi:hypothetical protein